MRQIADIFRTFLTLALPYFRSEEKWQARGLLAGVVVAEFGVVYALVAFNHWNGYFFNAIQDRNWNAFLFSLLLFAGIAVWTVLATMLQFYFGQIADPALAPLAHRTLRRSVDGRRPSLSGAVAAPGNRQRASAHRQ